MSKASRYSREIENWQRWEGRSASDIRRIIIYYDWELSNI